MKAELDRRQQRIAELMLQAEAERIVLGDLIDDYSHITGPFDRFYTRAIHLIRAHPLTTTLVLSLGGIAAVAAVRRLPYLPILGLIRGATIATVALRSLRAPSP